MKHFSLLRMGAITTVLVCLAPLATLADDYDKKTIVTFSQPVEVPGIVLEPGKYVIKLLKYPSDSSQRHIVEIMNERMDHLYALTSAVGAEKTQRSGKTVLTFYEGTNGRTQAIKTWYWPGDVTGIEFLYPKDQAARIAAVTNQKVAEGGLPTVAESGQTSTPDNEKSVTLQSENQAKPAATPFTADAAEPPVAAAPPPAPVLIAQNTPPPAQTPAAADTAQSNSPTVSSDANSSDTTLPQTASYLPLIGAIGVISLALALLVASVRRYRML